MTTIVNGARVRVVGIQRTGVVKRVEGDTTRVMWDEGSRHNPSMSTERVSMDKLQPVTGLGHAKGQKRVNATEQASAA